MVWPFVPHLCTIPWMGQWKLGQEAWTQLEWEYAIARYSSSDREEKNILCHIVCDGKFGLQASKFKSTKCLVFHLENISALFIKNGWLRIEVPQNSNQFQADLSKIPTSEFPHPTGCTAPYAPCWDLASRNQKFRGQFGVFNLANLAVSAIDTSVEPGGAERRLGRRWTSGLNLGHLLCFWGRGHLWFQLWKESTPAFSLMLWLIATS